MSFPFIAIDLTVPFNPLPKADQFVPFHFAILLTLTPPAAVNTPLACIVMAMELFGDKIGIYAAVSCVVAYLFSGHTGIYDSQKVGWYKHFKLVSDRGKKLEDL